ncbi:hypothetical protein IW140_005912 [Coemansia sp. RSA 1813]|nr:hypothetical protein EV178_005901 [Coemansia sp. RSA 1646]KAJ1767677.1 hypothetical protein LPJ74_005242 [Coemansia sp. RSA 1843]KAJ2086234.1 hypothetical protein IW138_005827 [Coemansia sp. RSA 986]KAJ2214900.1 hypothetical protein EV179_002575 [Coemansia sp. RSA 487]KAJ2563950.1 hypothetical protein IW140_005912 [Coemansia sp. RSA 1813]
MALGALSSVSLEECTTRDMLAILSFASIIGTSNWEEVAATASKSNLPFFGRSSDNGYTSKECERIYSKALQAFSSSSETGSEKDILNEAIIKLKELRLDEIQMRLKNIDAVLNSPIEISKSPLSPEMNKYQRRATNVASSDNNNIHNSVTKQQPNISSKIQATEVYTTPKEDFIEESAAKLGEEDSQDNIMSESSGMSRPHEDELAKQTEKTVYSKGDILKTEGNTAPEPAGDGIEDRESIDGQPSLSQSGKGSSTAAYDINDSTHSRLDEDKNGERETSADNVRAINRTKAEVAADDQQQTYGKNQGPEPVTELNPQSDSEKRLNTESNPYSTKVRQDNSNRKRGKDAEDSAAKTEGSTLIKEQGSVDVTAPVTVETKAPPTPAIDEQQLKNWKKNITMVWRELSGHRFGSMFISPIKSADAPNYYDVIRKPMDLKTIKNRIRDEEITTTVEFYRDTMHMLMNALMYNAEDTEVYQMAMEFIPDAQACIEQLLQTEEAVKHPESRNNSSGDMTDSNTLGIDVVLEANAGDSGSGAVSKHEDDSKSAEHHDEEDSDASSVPTKRRRRVASERASKHLRI